MLRRAGLRQRAGQATADGGAHKGRDDANGEERRIKVLEPRTARGERVEGKREGGAEREAPTPAIRLPTALNAARRLSC